MDPNTLYKKLTNFERQISIFHCLLLHFILLKEVNSLIFIGITSKVLVTKNETVSVPLCIVFTRGILKDF